MASPIDFKPRINTIKFSNGIIIVENISVHFLNINFSCTTVIDENTLAGNIVAVFIVIIIKIIFSFLISLNVNPLLNKLEQLKDNIIPTINTNIASILYISINKPISFCSPSLS